MSESRPFKPLEYECPICGKRGSFGEHHCELRAEGVAPEPRSGSRLSTGIKYGLSVLVALVLITAFLWEMIGPASLYLLAFVPIGALGYRLFNKLKPAGRGEDYRALLKMGNSDKEAVERLISMEGMKHPGRPRKELIRDLLLQWRRDLR
jgi:hypothetical protein